jgi:hypothetical protein
MTSDPHEPDLEALSSETGVPVDVLRTLASISDSRHAHRFTRRALRRALDDVAERALHAKAAARLVEKSRAVDVDLDDL